MPQQQPHDDSHHDHQYITSASQVKKLRELSGSSIGRCRQALDVSGNDLEKAMTWLKEKNFASVQKRMDKQAA